MVTVHAILPFVCSYLFSTLFWFLTGFKKRTKKQNLLLASVYIYFFVAIGAAFLLRWFLFECLVLPSFLESPIVFLFGVAVVYPFYRILKKDCADSSDN